MFLLTILLACNPLASVSEGVQPPVPETDTSSDPGGSDSAEEPDQSPRPFDEEAPADENAPYAVKAPWDHLDLTWCLAGTGSSLSSAEVSTVIRAAAQEWDASSRLTLTEVDNCDAADIVMDFMSGEHGDGSAFDGADGVLAHATYPPSGRMHFDDDETWTTALRPGGGQPIDLQTVALHEFGHALGIQHSATTDAVMYAFYGGSRRSLTLDDQLAIQNLYGTDVDGDGVSITEGDCDDSNPTVFPGAPDVWYDGVDSDCAGNDDLDADGDGQQASFFGGDDCDDSDSLVYLGAPETCDDRDNDCDGAIDENIAGIWYEDADVDGYGDPRSSTTTCTVPTGFTADDTDCDDSDNTAFPGATESFDGVDNNCDGVIDEAWRTTTLSMWFTGILSAGHVGGDKEFDGHGPEVHLTATLISGGTSISVEIDGNWRETHSDWTEGSLTTAYTVFTAPSGCTIAELEDDEGNSSAISLVSTATYTDTDHALDPVTGTGFVSQWSSFGDSAGDDIGSSTDDASIQGITFDLVTVTLYCP